MVLGRADRLRDLPHRGALRLRYERRCLPGRAVAVAARPRRLPAARRLLPRREHPCAPGLSVPAGGPRHHQARDAGHRRRSRGARADRPAARHVGDDRRLRPERRRRERPRPQALGHDHHRALHRWHLGRDGALLELHRLRRQLVQRRFRRPPLRRLGLRDRRRRHRVGRSERELSPRRLHVRLEHRPVPRVDRGRERRRPRPDDVRRRPAGRRPADHRRPGQCHARRRRARRHPTSRPERTSCAWR